MQRPRHRGEVGDVSGHSDKLLGQVLVSANSSLSRQGAFLFFGVTSAASLLLAGALAAQGFWPVLPFAGIELFALGLALGLSMKRGRYREFVSVYGDRIVIERGAGTMEERVELPRHWTRVELVPSPWRGHPPRLLLCYGTQRREIGAVLTGEERESLRLRLAELIAGTEPADATGRGSRTNE
ncbi:MAG: DUF2244 domain-containing protein [Gammaproteobacteria bacterium]